MYESLAIGRPFIATGYAGLNELGVLQFILQESLGYFARNIQELNLCVSKLIDSPDLIRYISHNCAALNLHDQTRAIANMIDEYIVECCYHYD